MGESQYSIPSRLDMKDLGKLTDSSLILGKSLRVESLRYFYLVKKTILKELNFHRLTKAKDLEEADYLISEELKQKTPLYMLADQTYGELVINRMIQKPTSHIEFHRIIENFYCWTSRYIHPPVSYTHLTLPTILLV